MQNRFTVSALQHGRRENPSIKEVLISALIREWQTSSILFLFDCFLVRTRQDKTCPCVYSVQGEDRSLSSAKVPQPCWL